jgi:osmotically-inducible protein OsmY
VNGLSTATLKKGVEKNVDAALAKSKLRKDVKYDVKNAVIALQGNVNTKSQRREAEKLASSVPDVKQVVNELQVKNEKASSKKTS